MQTIGVGLFAGGRSLMGKDSHPKHYSQWSWHVPGCVGFAPALGFGNVHLLSALLVGFVLISNFRQLIVTEE